MMNMHMQVQMLKFCSNLHYHENVGEEGEVHSGGGAFCASRSALRGGSNRNTAKIHKSLTAQVVRA